MNRPDFQNCAACEMPRSCQGVRHCAKKLTHRPRDPASLNCRIEALIAEHGPATVDDIAPLLPDVPRDSVRNTLANLRKTERLVVAKYGGALGRGLGSAPATYDLPGRCEPALREAPPEPFVRPAIASVWDLGRTAA